MHTRGDRPADASPAQAAEPAPEIEVPEVQASSAPLWSEVHLRAQAVVKTTPMWLRVSLGRDDTAAAAADHLTEHLHPEQDLPHEPAHPSIQPAPAPLWQSVHEESKRFKEPFFWRIAMRTWEDWEPAAEVVLASSDTPGSAAASSPDTEAPAAAAAAAGASLASPAADEGAAAAPPTPALVQLISVAEDAAASTLPSAEALREAAGPPPLWQQVHRQKEDRSYPFIIRAPPTNPGHFAPLAPPSLAELLRAPRSGFCALLPRPVGARLRNIHSPSPPGCSSLSLRFLRRRGVFDGREYLR